jgi:hypothetical protein
VAGPPVQAVAGSTWSRLTEGEEPPGCLSGIPGWEGDSMGRAKAHGGD